jgi:hypothetical protein
MVVRSDAGQPWNQRERVSNMVFIGRRLREPELREALGSCLVQTALTPALQERGRHRCR